MKRLFVTMIAAVGTVSMMAQETYENAKLATQDLSGTARYVGMGGAMEALGADITTMGTNPAGIGMYPIAIMKSSFFEAVFMIKQDLYQFRDRSL